MHLFQRNISMLPGICGRLFVAGALFCAGFAGAEPQGTAPSMVLVRGGTFQMGGTSGNEHPIHTVTIGDFLLASHEVTQAEWEALMGSNPSFKHGARRPVDQISWEDAIAYCNARSQAEGLRPCYSEANGRILCDWSAEGYRLPTEAEWEYAARGGALAARQTRYSGSDDVESVAWIGRNWGEASADVGTKAPNALGLYDMSGNAYEFVWDWGAPYPAEPQVNPHGPANGRCHVLRGGSWAYGSERATVSARYDERTPGCAGFRVARNAPAK